MNFLWISILMKSRQCIFLLVLACHERRPRLRMDRADHRVDRAVTGPAQPGQPRTIQPGQQPGQPQQPYTPGTPIPEVYIPPAVAEKYQHFDDIGVRSTIDLRDEMKAEK